MFVILEAEVDGDVLAPGDHILLEPDTEDTLPYVGTIMYMFNLKDTPMAHIRWFARGTDTVLGGTGDPAELFLLGNL